MDWSTVLRLISTVVLLEILISWATIPTAEMTRVFALAGTDNVKVPSVLVVVPMLLDFTITEALTTGSPLSSETLPETVLDCAKTDRLANKYPASKSKTFLIVWCAFRSYLIVLRDTGVV